MRTKLFYALSALMMIAMMFVTSCSNGDGDKSQDDVAPLEYEIVFNVPSVEGIYYISETDNTIEFTVDGYFTVISAELTECEVRSRAELSDDNKLDLTEKSSNEDGSITYEISLPENVKRGTVAILGLLSNGEKVSESMNFEFKSNITTSDSTTGADISDDIEGVMDDLASDGGSLAYIPKDETVAKEPLEIEMPKTEEGIDVEVDLTTQKGSVDLTIPADTKGGVTVKAAATEEAVTVTLPDAGSDSDKKDITVDAPNAKSITVEATNSKEKIELKVPSQSASEVVINAPASAEVTFSAPEATEPITIKTTSDEAADALVINAPNATVTLVKPDGSTITYKGVDVATADSTFIIGEGVIVDGLTLSKGNIEVYGTLTGTITRSEENPDAETIIYLHKGATFTPADNSNLTKIKELVKDASLATISIDPSSKDVAKEAGEFTLNLTSNYDWEATGIPSWITSLEPASGTGNKSIKIKYQANTVSEERVATITFKAGDKTAPFTLTQALCIIDVTGVTLDKTTLSMVEGQTKTETLVATVNPSTATNKTVTWTSSDEGVATVGKTTGVITAVKAGTATITVTTEDGSKTDTCTVKVQIDSESVTPPSITGGEL